MPAKRQFVLCLRNTGYEVSLERHKIYRVLSDREAAVHPSRDILVAAQRQE